jgi:isopenicillin N synthase-like dioxygenase
MPTTPIPVIDVEPARLGGDVRGIAAQIDAACRTTGFFQIVGHGVDPRLYHDYYRAAESVWATTREQEAALASPHPFRGLYRKRDDNGNILVDRFQNNHFEGEADARAAGVPEQYLDWFMPNLWPAESDDLKKSYNALFDATRGLGRIMMSLFAVALDVDVDDMMSKFANDVSYLAVHSYPGAPGDTPGSWRVPEHTDSGLLSMLHQYGDYEGLELRMASGEHLTVPVIDDALVLNIGDLMARWTNDQWLATPHAVIAGTPDQSRVSVATHYLPDVDAVVAPFASCVVGADTVYEPVTPYSWEKKYFNKPSLVLRLSDGEEIGATSVNS